MVRTRNRAYAGWCCRSCFNQKYNDIRKLAYRIAGVRGEAEFYSLPKCERLEARAKATTLAELGADFKTAEAAEATRIDGCVYVISHPRLEGVKVGRAFSPESRLRGYQTGCPRREYRLHYAAYFEDCHAAESKIHLRLSSHQLEGEWFDVSPDEAQECIEGFYRRAAA